ncbi:alpha/beta hydrolase [Portibacter marinus]|uniref:alpha/beta hydrolase n=1 Tax=Portibacter marinus TaxID=2898660 RepID=UPI001F3EAEAD|nr:alpha/beta hydrolase [Portibacter marinus]
MVRLVFIPSYGTDSSLYDNLRNSKILTAQAVFAEWIPASKSHSLTDYARKFIEEYNIHHEDTVIGVSFGGVLAIEINKLLKVRKVITISSIKCRSEKPRLFRILEKTGTYKLFKPSVLKFGLDLIVPLYGRNVASYLWFRRVFKSTENIFLKWALQEIVCWKNDEIPENLIHIHGTKDPLFPIDNAEQVDHVIEEGTHAMIRFKAKEIAEIIKGETS